MFHLAHTEQDGTSEGASQGDLGVKFHPILLTQTKMGHLRAFQRAIVGQVTFHLAHTEQDGTSEGASQGDLGVRFGGGAGPLQGALCILCPMI